MSLNYLTIYSVFSPIRFKLRTIARFLVKPANMNFENKLGLSPIPEIHETEIRLEDIQKVIIYLKDAVDVMKTLEKSTFRLEINDFTTVFLFLESARDVLVQVNLPDAAQAMDKVIKNIKATCTTTSEIKQKVLIAAIIKALNQVLYSIERSTDFVAKPMVTHMTYEEFLSKLAAYE